MNATPDRFGGLAERCLALLRAAAAGVATAESLTAGLVAATIADVPGASDALRGGLVAYASDVKTSVLGVSAHVVDRYGVVSAECAEAMARQACRLFACSYGLATTGVAGPDTQDGWPVGTVFVAVATGAAEPDVVHVERLALTGTRAEIRSASVQAVLGLLADVLSAAR